MKTSTQQQVPDREIGVYECEVKLKFRIIEEKMTMEDREHLLQMLVDAYSYGSDEFLESLHTQVSVQAVTDLKASPHMRRQLIRLRNSRNFA